MDEAVTVDPVMARIGAGIGLRGQGRPAEARAIFEEVWAGIGPEGDPFHRCALAHSMADVQDDPHEELQWDLLALASVGDISPERATSAGVDVAGFYPSLHLNLSDVYLRLGDHDRARHHLDLGQASVGALIDDGYAALIRGGLERLAARLGS